MMKNWPGAKWWKFDFHAHTPASKDTEAWRRAMGTPDEVTPEKWLLKFMEAEIDCVAITDHNSGEWIDRLKEAYSAMKVNPPRGFHEIHLFPGAEISVSSGLHALAIFDKEKTSQTVTHSLGATGFPEHLTGETNVQNEAACTRESLVKVVEEVHRRGGIAIPAHVDQDNGLLQVQGEGYSARYPDEIKSLLGSDLLAIEVKDQSVPQPSLYTQSGVDWTAVVGSDCHNFRDDSKPGSRFTWVKMGTPTLEGLRLALLDGAGISIRRSDEGTFDPFETPVHFIEQIEINTMRYMGRGKSTVFRFNPYFNALVGGRGTGKSTVVHALRLAYRREKDLERLSAESEPRQTFERFNRVPQSRDGDGGLQQGTEILLTLSRDGVRHRLRWQQEGRGSVVEEEGEPEQWSASQSQLVSAERFPVRIFSQGQIAALAGESQEALLAVIDEAAGTQSQMKALNEAKERFFALRAWVRELQGKLKDRDEIVVKLNDVRRKLKRFEDAHHTEVFQTYQRTRRQNREMERQFEWVAQFVAKLRGLAEELVPEELSEDLFDEQFDADGLAIVRRLTEAIAQAKSRVEATATSLAEDAQLAHNEMEKSKWFAVVALAREAYDKLISNLQAQGVSDPKEHGHLVQERQQLEVRLKELDDLKNKRDDAKGQAKVQFEHVKKARRAITDGRRKFLEEKLARNPFVRITLVPYGRDPQTIERSLRQTLGTDKYEDDIYKPPEGDRPGRGIVPGLLDGFPEDIDDVATELETRLDSLKDRLSKAGKGQGDFGAWFNKYLEGEVDKRPEFADHILCWFPDDGLQVEYSRKGDGRDFQPIGQASAGQRSAAMLAFLLVHGNEPIILDQPEDDLDNHLIYDLVVRQIREHKLRRQLIVVTHNPNIVVNGDAEMIYALEFGAGQCYVKQKGCLQEKAIRDEICRVMEGGREAFERRWRRLGKEV